MLSLSVKPLVVCLWLCAALAVPLRAQTIYGQNLIVNGDAESGPSVPDGSVVGAIPGWKSTGSPTVLEYGSAGFPASADPGPAVRGTSFFAGGPTSDTSTLTQTLDISQAGSDIDALNVTFQLSAYLGGLLSQRDSAVLTVNFLDASGKPLAPAASFSAGPVSAADRGNLTGLLPRNYTGRVPAGSRKAQIVLSMTRLDSTYNDGYADNLSFVLMLQSITGQTGNLIVNGDAEAGAASTDGSAVATVPGWTKTGNFSVEQYGQDGFPAFDDPGPPTRGKNFFTGGPDNGGSSASQNIDVSARSAAIDGAGLTFQLSGYLGGFSGQGDNAVLQATFQAAGGASLGTAAIGPVTSNDRSAISGLGFRTTTGPVPKGTRTIALLLTMTRTDGSYNDGYADNLSLTLSTAPSQPAVTAGGVVNAASFAGGGVSPGEIVTIFGAAIGPPTLTNLNVTGGRLDSSVGGVRVLFDGVPAPLIYVAAGQLSAIVPYGVASQGSTQLQIEYLGARSNTVSIPVQATAPALFTSSASGKGAAAALNQDGSVNTPSNPDAAGSIVVLYGTGEGVTTPSTLDGLLAVGVYPKPVQPVTVTIGGANAEVLYAGAAPNLVTGLIQINARIPAGTAPSAAVPVSFTVGGVTSPAGVVISVKGSERN